MTPDQSALAPSQRAREAADMAAALRNTPAEALREAGYLDRAADMLAALATPPEPLAGPTRADGGEAVEALIAWAREKQAFPKGNPGGSGRGHIDENGRFELRDLIDAIDAAALSPRQPEAVEDPDALTGCADDQAWADVPVQALREVASAPTPRSVQADRVMVPREPSEAMCKAGCEVLKAGNTLDREDDASWCWLAMLAAAPPPPASDRDVEQQWDDLVTSSEDALDRYVGSGIELTSDERVGFKAGYRYASAALVHQPAGLDAGTIEACARLAQARAETRAALNDRQPRAEHRQRAMEAEIIAYSIRALASQVPASGGKNGGEG